MGPGGDQCTQHRHRRRREGTEIFEGRKPDVIHYIVAPAIADKERVDYGSLIDERTPATDILKDTQYSQYSVPDTVVGYIGL